MASQLQIAKELSQLLPTLIRHMYPYVFEGLEVPPSQVIALVAIEERHGCTLSQLRQEMHVSAPTVTGVIDRLERDGYVKRIPDTKDRRVTNVILTAKGKGLIIKFREKIRKRWEYVLSKAPSDIGETILKAIRRLTQGFTDGTI